jgi:hypothetical protein
MNDLLKSVLLDICKHDNVHIQIARLSKIIRIYSSFKSDDIWEPIAKKLSITVSSSNSEKYYKAVATAYSAPLKAVNASNNMFFMTHSKRIYMVGYPQLYAMRMDVQILDTRQYPNREVVDIAASKNVIAFAVKNPNGIIMNDMGLLTRDQIDRQVSMNGILWTELTMFRNIKVKKIIAYWANLIILLENGSLISLFANRRSITDPWRMNTMILKLPDTLGTHNVILDIFETNSVYNLIREQCIDIEEDVEQVYPPIFKCKVTDGEVFVHIKPNDRDSTIPNTILRVLDNIDNER